MSESAQRPSLRHRSIFHQVAVKGWSVEQVAGRHGLKAATVRRIVRRVRAFHKKRRPGPQTLAPELALHLKRLEHKWKQAMQAWYDSQKEQRVVKLSQTSGQGESAAPGPGRVEQTRRSTSGDVRFLVEARRTLSEIRLISEGLGLQQWNDAEPFDDDQDFTLDARRAEIDLLLEQIRESEGAGPGQEPD